MRVSTHTQTHAHSTGNLAAMELGRYGEVFGGGIFPIFFFFSIFEIKIWHVTVAFLLGCGELGK